MIDYALDLLRKHQETGVVIDTNILLLYFVGAYNKNLIGNFKRTRQFTPEDFSLLDGIIDKFVKTIVTTPNILTETSNLLGQLNSPAREKCFYLFSAMVSKRFNEKFTLSSKLVTNDLFYKVGLTDVGIIDNSSRDNFLVITDDAALYNFLSNRQVDVINFNHIRTVNWKY